VSTLLVATTNPGKFDEVQAFLRDFPLQIVSLRSLTNPPAVVEDGKTFEENALKKALTIAKFSGLATLADDSGLVVEVLNGAGITQRATPEWRYDHLNTANCPSWTK
jgi:XTP/dITP diphosphohydrolase